MEDVTADLRAQATLLAMAGELRDEFHAMLQQKNPAYITLERLRELQDPLVKMMLMAHDAMIAALDEVCLRLVDEE